MFVFCGGCGTLVNFIISLLLAQLINSTVAYVGGYAVSLFVTYLLSSILIFKQRLSVIRFIKFIVSYIPNFLILFSCVAVLLNIFHIKEIIVYGCAAILGLPVTFILVKLFAFKKRYQGR